MVEERTTLVTVKRATAEDSAWLAECRTQMFLDMNVAEETTDIVRCALVEYLNRAIPTGRHLGWVALDGEGCVGGLCALIQEGPPFSRNLNGRSARLMSMYVVPERRRQGIGEALLKTALADLSELGIHVVSLVASEEGRPLYERFGFEDSPEMRLRHTSNGPRSIQPVPGVDATTDATTGEADPQAPIPRPMK